MHPAASLIAFTTLSGAGFGLIAWLGLGVHGEATGLVALVYAAFAIALASAGLLASTAHLLNPSRAWRAFSQWRSSWLSREGVVAVATLALFAVYAAAWGFADIRLPLLGAAASVGALLTVLCTAMIYAQLRTVPRWRHWSTPALLLALALAGGAALAGRTETAAGLLVISLAIQVVNWREGDRALVRSGTDAGSLTGLGPRGRVRQLAPPHTGSTWLTREMIHVVGRRRSRALRRLAVVFGYVLPALIFAFLEALPAKHALAGLGVLSHLIGVACSRWLFYAEAEHVVGHYYGREAG